MSKKLIQAAAGAGGESVYVEDVFSTYLYEGGVSGGQTITNNIDLSGEGGMVWIKGRNYAYWHQIADTERGANKMLSSNSTNAEASRTQHLTSFNSDGFTVGTDNDVNFDVSGVDPDGTYTSWSFRKQAGFFDVVTYTGTGVANRTVSHNLGSVPGCIIVKGVSGTYGSTNWAVYHRSLGAGTYGRYNLQLNTTSAQIDDGQFAATATDTEFTLGQYGGTNGSNTTYVAYLFAHDDQSFGDDSDESIIKCGSYTGNGNADGPEIDLGWEPQWLMVKRSSGASAWYMLDNMRGMALSGNGNSLYANLSSYENQYWAANFININSTGFQVVNTDTEINASGDTYIYIAIRRPMKTPESGTEVFAADFRGSTQATAAGVVSYSGFPVDLAIQLERASTSATASFIDRLRDKQWLKPDSTAAETPVVGDFDTMSGWWNGTVSSDTTIMALMFKRATGFFDVVAYTGDGASSQAITHNLGVTPEMMIVKRRESASDWICYHSGNTAAPETEMLKLNTTDATTDFDDAWRDTAPTSSVFTVGSWSYVNASSGSYIAYLFATLAGISKVGSYTGTGTTNNIDCGFSSSARFVMVKRTSSTGDWYVWDSARGITVGSDPFLKLNTSDAEGTTSDIIQPYSSGFTLTSNAGTAINGSGSSFIFLAIA